MAPQLRGFVMASIKRNMVVSAVLGGGFAAWWAMGVHFPTKNKMAAFREFNAEKYNFK